MATPAPSAAHALVGRTLVDGWVATTPIPRRPGGTGGNHSVGYIVERNGEKAFLKALDFSWALAQADPASVLQFVTDAFQYEKTILEKCSGEHLSRIVSMIGSGTERVPGFAVDAVPYMIFEWAEGDVRYFLSTTDWLDVSLRFACLHDVAVGIGQLHSHRMAHRDLKPSNVLVLGSARSKLGDLGRAAYGTLQSPFDPLDVSPFVGDPAHAPIEAMYKYAIPDSRVRRVTGDLFTLGSLALFMFTYTTAGAAMIAGLSDVSLAPKNWNGLYKDVVPYLHASLGEVVREFERDLPDVAKPLATVVQQLCDPDPPTRGHHGRDRPLATHTRCSDMWPTSTCSHAGQLCKQSGSAREC